MGNLLCFLPTQLVGAQVLAFLSTKDRVKLDSAVLNGGRYSLLHEMFLQSSPYHLTSRLCRNPDAWQWYWKRGIVVRNLYLSMDMVEFGTNNAELLVRHKTLVQGSISVDCKTTSALDAAEHFLCDPNLISRIDSFTLLICSDDCEPLNPLQCLKNVKNLSIYNMEGAATSLANNTQSQSIIKVLLQSVPSLTCCWIFDCGLLGPEVFQPLAWCSATLSILFLVSARLPNASLLVIARHCPCLTNFDVEDLGCSFDPIVDSGLIAIAHGCPLLQRVSVNFKTSTEQVLETYFSHCPLLQELNTPFCTLGGVGLQEMVRRCHDLTSVAVQLSGTVTLEIKSAGKALHKLRTAKFNILFADEASFRNDLLVHFQSLEELTWQSVQRMNFNFLAAIASSCSALTFISLGGSIDVDEQPVNLVTTLAAIARSNPNLKTIVLLDVHVKSFASTDINSIFQNCPNLTEFYLVGGLNDAFLLALATHCPKLTRVNCGAGTTDHGVLALVTARLSISSACFDYSPYVTEESMLKLVLCSRYFHYLKVNLPPQAVQRLQSAILTANKGTGKTHTHIFSTQK